jgi:hypothetical protein
MSSQVSGFVAPSAVLPEFAKTSEKLQRGRTIAKVPKAIMDLSERTQAYIFSVGPWSQMQHMGSLGRYFIPACKEGEKYSKPVIIPGLTIEHYPMKEGTLDLLMDEKSTGMDTAMQILQVGKFQLPGNSLLKYGCTVSECWPPKQETIDKANALLDEHCDVLIEEADLAFAKGPQEWQATRSERHFWAARRRNKTAAECQWMGASAAANASRQPCPFCGLPTDTKYPKCQHCKEIINQAAYKDAQKAARAGLSE